MADGGQSPDSSLNELSEQIQLGQDDGSCERRKNHSASLGQWCDPCHRQNTYMPAHRYCPECSEYYCTDCGNIHGRFAATMNHSTLTGSEMPDTQPVRPLQFENCILHIQNLSDQFCTRHKELLCRCCVNDTHTSCEIKSVPEISENFDISDVCKFKSLLYDIRKGIQSNLSVFEQNLSDIENQRKLVEHRLKGTYDVIIGRVNKLYNEAHDELELVHNKIKTYLVHQNITVNKVLRNIDNSVQNLEKLTHVDAKVFLHLQDIAKTTREDVFKINEIQKTVRNHNIKTTINQKLQDIVDATPDLATTEEILSDYRVIKSLPMVTFPVSVSLNNLSNSLPLSKENLKKIVRFNAKLPDDKEDCGIVGVDVTSDGRIAVADFKNMNIKCFDPCQKYHSCLQLDEQPSDLAVFSNDEAVISLWCQSKLYVTKMKDFEIKIKKTIQVDAPVSAVSVYKDNIIVNCREGTGSVKLIDKCGKVYWSRSIDSDENELFKHPRCNTCFSYKRKFIAFVTDYNKRTITKLGGRTGDVKAVLRLQDRKDPFGVTNDKRGNIYVCYRETNEIATLTADLEHQKLLLTENDGLGVWPNCVKYVASTNQLFVCYSGLNESRNSIDCYQIS